MSQVILTMAQQAVVDRYRASGHCVSFNPLNGYITLHGYRRHTPDAAVKVMEREMDPAETLRRVVAGLRAIHKDKSE